mmetsp:Transcript_37678/g.91514  ORF Transcript_37678/g.91514 Transcript_37678/m.91514 type:complete len:86 (-) Transcript_37678:415-672(-)
MMAFSCTCQASIKEQREQYTTAWINLTLEDLRREEDDDDATIIRAGICETNMSTAHTKGVGSGRCEIGIQGSLEEAALTTLLANK